MSERETFEAWFADHTKFMSPEYIVSIDDDCREAWQAAKAYSAAEIADLTQKLEDARKDAERFAWLDKQLLCADFYYGEDRVPVLVFSWPRHVGIGGNLRMNVDAAIDAAMKDAPYEQA